MVDNKEKGLKYVLGSQLIVLTIYVSLVVLCTLVFGPLCHEKYDMATADFNKGLLKYRI